MNRLIAALTAVSAVALLSACEDPQPVDDDMTAPPVEAMPEAPAAEDAGVETAAPVETTPPVDPSTLPADKRTSEESVQPESETLFY